VTPEYPANAWGRMFLHFVQGRNQEAGAKVVSEKSLSFCETEEFALCFMSELGNTRAS